jgi:hypothetical protein
MKRLRVFLIYGILGASLLQGARCAESCFPDFWKFTPEAVEQAHAELWNRLVDRHGIILDNAGDLPTPEDCRLGKPNAIGWWSPIENGPMFTGLYLPAACERGRRSGNETDKASARRAMSLIGAECT